MDQPIALSESMLALLGATRPWVKFIAIVWFVGVAFMPNNRGQTTVIHR